MNRFFVKKFIFCMSFIFFAGILSSCALEALWGGYATTETLTIINTDKTIADNIASTITNKDCNSIRKNTEYCLDKEKKAKKLDEVYCYRTLADPICYTEKRPYGETNELNTLIKQNKE